MDKAAISSFFDGLAAGWDKDCVRRDDIMNIIFEKTCIASGDSILDIGCGTGVLFADLLARGAKVTGIDISKEMTGIAAKKFPGVDVLLADAEEMSFEEEFDKVMVFNALPHFLRVDRLIGRIAAALKAGGRVVFAHDMSRKTLNEYHSQRAEKVSSELMEAEELAAKLAPYFEVDVQISDEKMYMVSGKRLNYVSI